MARAGWEGKFTAAALEEAGWRVEARFAIAPGTEVRQGQVAAGTIDTSRHAAVVALDASAAPFAAAIARFVRDGGGAVIGADALASFAAIAPADVAGAVAAIPGALESREPRRGLAAATLRPVAAGAVVVERRGDAPVAVAARASLGRVLALGARETWRWRMAGGEGSADAHRAWWSAAVTSVAANRPPSAKIGAKGAGEDTLRRDDPAPMASLVAALGPPARADAPPPSVPTSRSDAILFALTLAGLLTEWASRRARGAR